MFTDGKQGRVVRLGGEKAGVDKALEMIKEILLLDMNKKENK